jgi:hypothetical protein
MKSHDFWDINQHFRGICFTIIRVTWLHIHYIQGDGPLDIHKFMAFSLQANYTDWVTATSWQIVVQSLVDRGMSCCQCGGTPTAINLSFLDWSRHFFFQVAPHLSSRGWVDPSQSRCYSENLVVPGIKPGTLGSAARDWPVDHRGSPCCTYVQKNNKTIRSSWSVYIYLVKNGKFFLTANIMLEVTSHIALVYFHELQR